MLQLTRPPALRALTHINTEAENTIYRSCGIAIANRSRHKAPAKEFADFLQSAEGQKIFVKWGWIAS